MAYCRFYNNLQVPAFLGFKLPMDTELSDRGPQNPCPRMGSQIWARFEKG